MGFLVYIEIGLVIFTVGMVAFVLKLAKRDKAAALNKESGKEDSGQ